MYSALSDWLRALNKLDLFSALVEHTVVISALYEGEMQGTGEQNLTLPGGRIRGFLEEVTCELNSRG